MKVKVQCKICGKEEFITESRSKRYVTCSKSCLGKYKTKTPNQICNQCGNPIYVKPSKTGSRMGNFCSIQCLAAYQRTAFLGEKNPNYRNRRRNEDGYVMQTIPNIGSVKVHKYVALTILGIDSIPKGYHIHHRDCNRENNLPDNLVLLSTSDHKWLHSQVGSAVLWGYCNNKFNKQLLLECCNDTEKALKLLDLTIEKQIGIYKSDKLLENPEEDNQQPS